MVAQPERALYGLRLYILKFITGNYKYFQYQAHIIKINSIHINVQYKYGQYKYHWIAPLNLQL